MYLKTSFLQSTSPCLKTPIITGNTMSERSEQGDDKRWCLMDDYQYRQGRVHVLRGHGACQTARYTGTHRQQSTGRADVGIINLK